jgi:hypothetical protein
MSTTTAELIKYQTIGMYYRCRLFQHNQYKNVKLKVCPRRYIYNDTCITIPYGGLFSRGANFRVPSKNAKLTF